MSVVVYVCVCVCVCVWVYGDVCVSVCVSVCLCEWGDALQAYVDVIWKNSCINSEKIRNMNDLLSNG